MKHGHVIWGTPALLKTFAEECNVQINSSLSLTYPTFEVGFDEDGFKFYGSYGGRTGNSHFHLPKDWDKAVLAIKNQYAEFTSQPTPADNKVSTGSVSEAIDINTLKYGDFVVVLPEDNHYYNCEHNDKGEVIPQMFLQLTQTSKGWVDLLFSNGSGSNCYQKVRRATPEEIEQYHKVPEEVGGHKLVKGGKSGESTKSTIGYGCRQFTQEDIDALINALRIATEISWYEKFTLGKDKITIGDTSFTIGTLAALKLKIKQ